MSVHEDYEDIMHDSLEFLGGTRVIENDIIRYGPLQLTVAPKDGKANTLLADHLFSPALFLAERIERNLLDVKGRTVIELGAGAALPSLLLSTLSEPPSLIVITDYPDDGILGNLKSNLQRNEALVSPDCKVLCSGYDWGTDASLLLKYVPRGYDILILSDLLHFHSCHDVLLCSIALLMKRSPEARVHVGAGIYTKPEVCAQFLEKAKGEGLEFEGMDNIEEGWLGKMEVSNLDKEALATRKANCRYWIGKWI